MTKNILVTGGAGFIGSHLCEKLLQDQHEVYCIDNLSLGKKENIQGLFQNRKFHFYEFDVSDHEKLYKTLAQIPINTVFHLAANSDIAQSSTNPSIDLINTFQTTVSVLELMRKTNIKEIIFASTSAVYGEQYVNFTENHGPLCPISHYGAAKLSSEAFLSSYCNTYGIQTWISRFPNVVGGRATHGVVFDFIKKLKANPHSLEILGDGEQNKPYIYVGDLIEAIFYIWKNARENFNVFNLGVASRTKVRKIAEIISQQMKITPEFRFTGGARGWKGDIPEFQYDLTKIHKLGWKSKLSSDEAIAQAAIDNLRGLE